MIRDTGKEVFYSTHDAKAEHVAKRYAERKWGKRLILGKGRIMFQSERECQQSLEISRRSQGLSR